MTTANTKNLPRVIWSNANLDLDDYRENFLAECPEMGEEEMYENMLDINCECLDDQRMNLDIQLSRAIIIIADVGRWNGRFTGFKIIESGNIKDCLYSNDDMVEWYLDKLGDLRSNHFHHDGCNYCLYRVFKDNVSDTQIENFKDKITSGSVTRADITKMTRRLGDEIACVYGI